MSSKRVAIALSGGVDSSVAAYLLKEADYDVIGVTMRLWTDKDLTCPSAASIRDSKSTCIKLGIPFHLIDLENEFQRYVIDYFCSEYARGRTPNPCVACNRYIKFGCLMDHALSIGADYFATGHYARVEHHHKSYHLLKGLDISKDQSYVLYTLGQDRLSRVLFPLGNHTKSQVQDLALQKNLPTAGKPSSQDICFVDSDYGTFLSRYLAVSPGEIVDSNGKVLGQHKGLIFYTVGQRQGLGLTTTEPLYVTAVDADKNQIIVGSIEDLYRYRLIADEVSWPSGRPPSEPLMVTVKIRYRSPDVTATLLPSLDSAEVILEEPQPAITAGQAVVFYKDDEVLGGGTIDS